MDVSCEPVYELDWNKFKNVVHYICSECRPEELGNVKLHKILYFADMIHFLSFGHPMTGVEYQKQQFGPIARQLTWAINILCKEQLLKVETRDYFGFSKVDYTSLKQPSRTDLSNSEIQILQDVIEFVCSRSAKEISEFSHKAPWEAAEISEIIPYFSAYGLLPSSVSDADVAAGYREAMRVRPIIENEAYLS